jgi:hypothetical protein
LQNLDKQNQSMGINVSFSLPPQYFSNLTLMDQIQLDYEHMRGEGLWNFMVQFQEILPSFEFKEFWF